MTITVLSPDVEDPPVRVKVVAFSVSFREDKEN